ncbi:histidine ammonia-lyase [Culturomica massiliensis]|jgi:histidine ammonia-lyase|uniref:histidine ammonia-lyase n=1 Tax=Culturomica massiliensis TaxID=1841857 RepID=UPI000E560C3E|nr:MULTISPECIES: histidine ammonia-lyase [Odoribacteraceae]RHV95956.1 histidine ammonia-lyase [Odoribacter sp. OF09-27XD]
MIHYISPVPLTFETIENILNKGYKLALSEESKQLINDCKAYLDEKIARSEKPLYGITTGFGSLCKISISPEDLSQLQANLVMSHACSVGEPIHKDIVRLMLLLKAHALSLGKSGVQLATVERIIDMYNHDVLPVVRELGSLGASGDLAPLANLFLPLINEGTVYYKGKIQDAKEVNEKLGWSPIALGAKEGLALLNGTQFMSSHAVYALLKAFKIVKYADIIGAISLDAYDGRIDPFLPQIHEARPHPGQIETARNIRALLKDSEFQQKPKVRVQDPYSFRCMPQVHGACKDTVMYVASVVEREINSVTDNPTIFVKDDMIVSGGNFHGEPLALVLDFLSIALAELGSISERRTYRLISGDRGHLPEFLVANPGLNSGFMIPQYAAAAIVSKNKQLCTPCSVDSIPSSNEQEDHVSMGGNAATKTVKVCENVERILAIELLNAAQAIDLQRPGKTSPYLEEFLKEFRTIVPFNQEDRVMYKDIDAATAFLQEGEFHTN